MRTAFSHADAALPLAAAATARAPAGDIAASDWRGHAIDCTGCTYQSLSIQAGEAGCEPGHACMQDAYARRIDRFFRWHPALADEQLDHPYFEVRAIAARYASVFRLGALIDDPDETVRLQLALRLPRAQLVRLVKDPHREVRIRVAQRIEGAALAAMHADSDYAVREWVARRLPVPLLALLMRDGDREVRMRVAERMPMPGLLAMASDADAQVRRIVAARLPAPLLGQLLRDEDWGVRWEIVRRGAASLLARLSDDADPEVRSAAAQRLAELSKATHHG